MAKLKNKFNILLTGMMGFFATVFPTLGFADDNPASGGEDANEEAEGKL